MTRSLLLALALSAAAAPAFAGDRVYSFAYGSSTLAEGRTDLEFHSTLEAHSQDDHGFRQLDVREEVEYGLTNTTQVSLYLNQSYTRELNDVTLKHDTDVKFTTVDGEIIHSLTSSAEDGLGTAVYGEVSAGAEHLGFEGKFLMEKQLGQDWDFVANLVVEKEWDGAHYQENTVTLGLIGGASYRVSAQWSVGAETRIEKPYDIKGSKWGDVETYVGPNVAYHDGKFFAVVTPMFQVSSVSDAPDYMTKAVIGWKF